MRKIITILLLFCLLIMVMSACITVQYVDSGTSNINAGMESKIKSDTKDRDISINDDYIGSWTGVGMMLDDEELMPVPDNLMEMIIKSNGYWSFTFNEEVNSGDWKIEKIDGEDVLVCYQDNAKAIIGMLSDDGFLGIRVLVIDENALLLFEKN